MWKKVKPHFLTAWKFYKYRLICLYSVQQYLISKQEIVASNWQSSFATKCSTLHILLGQKVCTVLFLYHLSHMALVYGALLHLFCCSQIQGPPMEWSAMSSLLFKMLKAGQLNLQVQKTEYSDRNFLSLTKRKSLRQWRLESHLFC